MRVTGTARKVLLTIGIVVGVILLALASLSLAVQIPSIQAQIRSRIQSELHTALDRDVEIGEVRLGLFFRSLDVDNIRIASGERLQDGVLAEIEGVEIYPSLVDLLRLRIGLNRIVVRRPTVALDVRRHKAEPAVPQPSRVAPSMPVAVPLGIEQVEIRDATIRGYGTQLTVARLHADLQAPAGALRGTLTIEQTRILAGATPLLVDALVLKAGIEGDDIQVTEVHLSAPGAAVEAQGRVLRFLSAPTFDLTLKARSELAKVFPEGPPLPLEGTFELEGKVAGSLEDPSFTGHAAVGSGQIKHIAMSGMTVAVQANRRELHLNQFNLQTAQGSLTGDIALTWEKLRYDIALRGKQVNLAEVLQLATGDAPVGGETMVEIQATGEGRDFSKANGQAKVRVEEFHLSDHPKDRGHVHIALDARNGRVHLRQGEVELARTHLRTKGVVKLGGDVDLDVHMRFSKLEDFGRLLGADPGDVDGQATIKGRLTGSLADPVLRGTLDWTNATLLEVTFDSLRAPVEIAFARQTLTSPSMTVIRKKLRADLQTGLTLAPKPPDRKLLLKYDLTLDIEATIKGPLKELLDIFVKEPVPLAGPMQLKAQVRGTPDTLRAQGILTLTDAVILDEPWEQVQTAVDLDVQQKRVSLDGLTLRRRGEKVAGRFEIGFDGNSQFDLSSSPIAIQHVAPLQDSGLTGTVTVVSAKGHGPIGHPRIDITLEVADLAHHDAKVGDGQGTLTWDLSQDRLTGQLSIPERGYTLQPNITTKAPHPYEAALTLKQGDLGSLLRIVGHPLPAHVSGVASGRIDVAGRLGERPERVTVNFDAARLDIRGQSFQTEGPTRLTFEKGELTIVPVTLSGEGSAITVGGTIGKEMDLKILGAAPAALAALVSPDIRDATGILDLDMTIQGPQQHPRYRGHIQSKDASLTLQVHPDPIQDLQGEIRFTETGVETDGLKAQWGGGKIDAKIQGRPERHGWGWHFQFTLEDARVERIFVITEGGEKTPMGVGPLQASGNITAGDAREFVASLGGRLRIETVNGVIHRSFSLQKALSLINLSFLFTKGPDEKGLPYDEISGTFHLENGIAKTEDFKLRSPVLRVAGVGQLDLPQSTIDAHMAVQPLQLSDKVLQAVGNAPIIKQIGIGTLLFGKNRAIMVVSYRVHGPITDPEVTKVPTKAVDKGVLGIFGRTLELPADALSGEGHAPSEEKPTPSGPDSPD
jgi:autotransporter translocation and assembly factor TamB